MLLYFPIPLIKLNGVGFKPFKSDIYISFSTVVCVVILYVMEFTPRYIYGIAALGSGSHCMKTLTICRLTRCSFGGHPLE